MRTVWPMSGKACSAQPYRPSGPPTRPTPRSRTSMSGRRPGPRSYRTARRRRRRRKRRSSGSRRSFQNTRSRKVERRRAMTILSRRSVLRRSLAAGAAWMLARPYLANAAATTATVWWVQGFAEEEDISFKKIVADYAKASGNTIDYSIIPYAPERQKIVSAMTSGVVPDLFQNNPAEIIALYAWEDKLVDVTDVIETQKEEYTDTALLTAHCYNNVEKKRSFYGVPYTSAVRPNHIWRPLVEKAGYTMEDLPRTWDAFYDFFKEVQKKLRAQGERKVYGLGFQMNTTGNDCNALFDYFLIAHGAQDIVTKDGRLHVDYPKVREAVLETLTYPTTAYKEGFVPPGAINWNDADDNNAFHAKQIVMDLDGTISTEVAVIHKEQD